MKSLQGVRAPEQELPVRDAHAHVPELPAKAVPQDEGPEGMQMPDTDAGSDLDKPGCEEQAGKNWRSKRVHAETHRYGFFLGIDKFRKSRNRDLCSHPTGPHWFMLHGFRSNPGHDPSKWEHFQDRILMLHTVCFTLFFYFQA
jgi:hypothetical protein